MNNTLVIINTIAPVFLIIMIGFFVKAGNIIDDRFVRVSSKLVFRIALPAMIFLKIASTDFNRYLNWKLILFYEAATLSAIVIVWIVTKWFIREHGDRAVFIQGSFRGNIAIVGFAVVLNTFGNGALFKAAILLAFTMPIYNIFSIFILSGQENKDEKKGQYLLHVITNPLILSAILAFPFSYFNIGIPDMLVKTGNYLSAIALPLALLSIGGSLHFRFTTVHVIQVVFSSLLKIFIFPLVFTAAAFRLGFSGEDLGVIFLFFAVPTAVSSFIMAEAMHCNSKMAGDIISISTLGSILTIPLGLILLSQLGWI